MKIVINVCFGGFGLSEEAKNFFERKFEWLNNDELRTNPLFIQKVEEKSEWVGNDYSKLRVVEIPDEATDYEINEYDGFENIIYVKNGKIYHINFQKGKRKMYRVEIVYSDCSYFSDERKEAKVMELNSLFQLDKDAKEFKIYRKEKKIFQLVARETKHGIGFHKE